ncbi:MAG: M3 family metallopeptidase [Bdellovibrionales bacterium]|nr:M3 family metallopeptidase [Bdellovibrionales bacterium]
MNPLLQPSPLKNSAVPFDKIKPEHFLPALQQAIASGHKRLSELKSHPASFDNTMRGLEAVTEEMEFVYGVFGNLMGAHTSDELQALAEKMGPTASAFANDILLDPAVFGQVKSVYEQRHSSALNEEQIRLVEKVYRDFQRSGAALNEAQKTRMREIDARLSQLHPKFRENVLKATNDFEMWIDNEADLAGLPATQITAAKEAAKEKGQPGKWLFTLQYPSYFPFLHFSTKRKLREKMFRAYLARGFGGKYDNQALIHEIVSLMHEKAALMGFKSYADYALETRMAETPTRVTEFLNKILKAAKPAAQREIDEITKLSVEMGGPAKLESWDLWFYAERLKEKRYSFDQEQLRPYLQLENVLAGVFEHARRLFGLTFKETNEYPVYHEDVKVYEVYKQNGEKEFIGLFYADFFPRASKNGGAWMTNFYEQGVFRGKRVRPHVSIVCNFTKPTAEKPSLLTFDEVSTLFHEFGHALHSLLSQVEYRSLAGTNVYLDFVELPSQILENWAEEEESLKLFARHYQTGEMMPMELVDRLKRSQRFMAGYYTIRQLNFAFLDLAWFTAPPKIGESIADFEDKVTSATTLLPHTAGANISSSFGHIFGGGYASGYYSYKWAEALDADAFELFKEKGIFDVDTARRFEEHVLSKGGSDHPMRLYEKFRGRSPDPEALLRRDGLI